MDTDNEEYSIYNTFKKAYESATQEELAEIRKMLTDQLMKPFAQGPAAWQKAAAPAPIKPVLKNHMVVFRYVDDGFEVAEKELKTKTLFVEATDDRDAVIYAMSVFRQEHDAKSHVIHAFVVPSFDLNRIE
jgi:hypothetical protein